MKFDRLKSLVNHVLNKLQVRGYVIEQWCAGIRSIGTLSALIGTVLIIPFRIPPIAQIEGPAIVFLMPLFWTSANAWRVKDAHPVATTANQKVNWIPVVALIALLAIFRLLLAPGIAFF